MFRLAHVWKEQDLPALARNDVREARLFEHVRLHHCGDKFLIFVFDDEPLKGLFPE